MALKKTVAIIGATTPLGKQVAESLATSSFLLLMDSNEQALLELAAALHQQHLSASIETLMCSKEASWEADAVVVTVESDKVPAIAEKIKAVTTCKPVLHFTADNPSTLSSLLPHAHVVTVWMEGTKTGDNTHLDAFVTGTDPEAQAFAQTVLTALGCHT